MRSASSSLSRIAAALPLILACGIIAPLGAETAYAGKGPISDKPITLTVLAINSYYSSADLAISPVALELAKRAGITIKYQLLPPGNYPDALRPRLAAGADLPDIILLPDKDPTMKYIMGGLFIPIDSLYEKYGVNMKKLYAKSSPYAGVKSSLTTPEGKMYYVPQLGLGMNYQPCFMVNEKWLAALGLKEPTTLDEFTNMLRAFRDKDPNKNGKKDEIPLSIEKAYLQKAFGPMFGLDLYEDPSVHFQADKKGKVSFGYMESAYKDYVTYLNMLYKEGLLDPDFVTTTMDQETSRFAKDITGVDFHFSWLMSQGYSNQYKDYDGKNGIIKGILPVKGKYGDRYYLGRDSITGLFGISKDCKNPEAAFKFLDLAIGEESQLLYNWGIEGDTYTVTNGKKAYTANGKDNDYIQKFGIDPVCLPLIQSTAMAEGILPPWHVQFDYAVAPYMKAPWPFIYSLPAEASIENQYLPDITTYVVEMELKFIMGIESVSNFDKYLATLKKMGIDKVLAVRQAQYDRYLAAAKK